MKDSIFSTAVAAIDKLLSAISHRLSNVGQVTLVAMVLLITADVILRRLFNSPLPWSLELVEIMLVLVVFFSVAYCGSRQGHVSIDVLVSRFPQRLQSVIDIIVNVLGFLVFATMCWGSITSAIHTMHVNRITGLLPIPVFPFVLAVALGSCLLALVVLVQLLKTIIKMVNR
ncbi:MAG: TRAP transporter small permease [Dehalococcoidales bacterium]|nr:TRAP transporter small permease [Dehalococcoidales bacterium]